MIEHHARLRRLAQRGYVVPGLRPALREALRETLQHTRVPHPIKQRLFNFFAHDLANAGLQRCAVDIPGRGSVSLTLNLADDLSRCWYYWGYVGFERGLTRLFRRLVRSGSCVFDVGAHVGYYTVLAASGVAPLGSVHAFEPRPDVFSWLSRNSPPHLYRQLRLNQGAMGDIDGEAWLHLPESDDWTNASLIAEFTRSTRRVPVHVTRFDTYCRDQHLEHVDLVKIDVEGSELGVLKGMGELLDEWHPDIILEVLEPFAPELEHFFEGKPYRKFLITDDGLRELHRLTADPTYRDVYLSVSPSLR